MPASARLWQARLLSAAEQLHLHPGTCAFARFRLLTAKSSKSWQSGHRQQVGGKRDTGSSATRWRSPKGGGFGPWAFSRAATRLPWSDAAFSTHQWFVPKESRATRKQLL